MPRPEAPRIYFSLRSPYSWLACHDLFQRHGDIAGSLEWIPFWEPNNHAEDLLAGAGAGMGGHWVTSPVPRERRLYIQQDVHRLARARGLSLTWPADRPLGWDIPHLAFLFAKAEGMARPLLERMQRARWEEGRDICAPSVVRALAAEVGLPPLATATAWQDGQWRAMGVIPLARARADGVFGVPFLICGQHRFWGVDRVQDFVQTLPATQSSTH